MIGLHLTGTVDVAVPWAELRRLPGLVGDVGTLVPGAVGTAVPVASILDRIDLGPEATHCSVVSRDASYSASIPIDDLRSGGWLAFALDDAPLPAEHGGPLRLTVAEGATLCWNVKDVAELRFTTGKEPDSVPERPSH